MIKRRNRATRQLIIMTDYIIVPLTRGEFSIIDHEDIDVANGYNWYAHKSKDTSYAARAHCINGKIRNLFLHTAIMNTPDGLQVDHLDGNGLNNCRINLRFVNHSENQRNSRKPCNNTSGYKGVTWHNGAWKWRAQIMIYRKHKHIGFFDITEEAARAYDAAALIYHGEFASLNFPDDKEPTNGAIRGIS